MNIWLIKYNLTDYNNGRIINDNWKEIRREYKKNTLAVDKCKELEFEFFDDGPSKIPNVIAVNSGAGITCVDEHTKKIIGEKYADIIDFIPLKVKETGEIKYLMNIKAINDSFDEEKSECRINSGIIISSVRKYVFKDNVLEYDIFNCYELGKIERIRTYCNDNYKKLIEDNNITGYRFIKIFEVEDK